MAGTDSHGAVGNQRKNFNPKLFLLSKKIHWIQKLDSRDASSIPQQDLKHRIRNLQERRSPLSNGLDQANFYLCNECGKNRSTLIYESHNCQSSFRVRYRG